MTVQTLNAVSFRWDMMIYGDIWWDIIWDKLWWDMRWDEIWWGMIWDMMIYDEMRYDRR